MLYNLQRVPSTLKMFMSFLPEDDQPFCKIILTHNYSQHYPIISYCYMFYFNNYKQFSLFFYIWHLNVCIIVIEKYSCVSNLVWNVYNKQ